MKDFLIQHGAFLFWMAVAIVSLIIEALTTELVSCWFAPSAIVSMILSGFVDIFWVQLLVFLVLSVLLLAFA
ncbi:MAG: NfeD family protein, partial [Clostridia bacterium]|nr:NfeD family protein [Clostridia bacterium]